MHKTLALMSFFPCVRYNFKKIEPSRSKNLTHDRFLTGRVDVVRSFSLTIGTVKQLTVFWISEQNFDDSFRPRAHRDVQGCVPLQICRRNFRFFLEKQFNKSGVALTDRTKEWGVSINCLGFKICQE